MKGKDGTTPFLPSKEKTGGKVNFIQNKETMCLTEKQTTYTKLLKGEILLIQRQ